MGHSSTVSKIEYSKPVPFACPTIWDTDGSGANLIPRQTLHYSASAVEEIMYKINEEYRVRGMAIPTWKRYKSSLSDYDTFKPNIEGSNLHSTAVKWFPQYVIDIQAAIDVLIADPLVPDNRASYLARIFCNNTSPIGAAYWNSDNKLKDGIIVPFGAAAAGEHRAYTLNPLTRAKAGNWLFEDDFLKNCVPFIGITPSGIRQSNLGTTDTIKSVISNPDANGNIGGLTPNTPMTASNRPTSDRKIISGLGAGQTDFDEGYGYLAHLALTLEQLRYQPPIVENWPNNVMSRHYVSNLHSGFTANIPWYLAQPVETFHNQNWGFWLLGGLCGVAGNSLFLRTYEDPQVVSAEAGQCEYAIIFPPPEAPCWCMGSSSAWAIWWANEASYNATWDSLNILVTGTAKQEMKVFGPHTKFKMSVNFGIAPGVNDTVHKFFVMIKTARIGIGDNPWVKIIEINGNYSGTIEFNLMERIHNSFRDYEVKGRDAIMQLGIWVQSSTEAHWIVRSIDNPIATTLPSDATTRQICQNPTCTLYCNYIALEESAITGDVVNNYK